MKTSIVNHHTGNPSTEPQYESVRDFHNRGGGGKWPKGYGCQYHYFIEDLGIVIQANPEDKVTWHAGSRKYNQQSIAICLAGDFRKKPPSKEQITALTKLITDIQTRWGISDTSILLHKDVRKTECPGMDLRPLILEERTKLLGQRIHNIEHAIERAKEPRRSKLQRLLIRLLNA